MPQHYALPMQNSQYHVVLLAGGPRDVARELRCKVAAVRNILIRYHLEYDKENQWNKPIPRDVDFVIMLKDMMSHSQFNKLKESCKKMGLRWIVTQRKMSILVSALANYGIRKSEGVPLKVSSTSFFEDAPTPPAPPTPAPIKMAEPPPKVENAMPEPAKVNVFVSTSPVPEGAPLERRRGTPRPETMVLIATLQLMAQDDAVDIMITPTCINIEPSK